MSSGLINYSNIDKDSSESIAISKVRVNLLSMADAMRTHYRRKFRRNVYIGILTTAFISLSFLLYFTIAEKSEDTLQLLLIVFRHGDRTPTESYVNDPYKNYNWPDGWGSLTKKGKHQLFHLGQTLNARYKTFIGDSFSPNSVYVRASDSDRCHMSAATLLAGMFPPTATWQIWNDDLLWQPIPIHSLPRNLDNIVVMKKPCPTYDQALKEAYVSNEITNLNKIHAKTFEYLTNETGQVVSNITAVEFLYNTLEIEESNGLSLPAWTKNVYPTVMRQLAARSLSIFTETLFMRKMKGGVLLKDMITHLNKTKHSVMNKKIFLYSGHDISLVNFMRTVGFVEDMKPDYGSAFVLELHKINNSEDMEIRMLYYNNTNLEEPKTLVLNSCGFPCNFEQFLKISLPVIPDDWEKECQF